MPRFRSRLTATLQALRDLGVVGPLAVMLVALPFAGIAVLVAWQEPLTAWLAAEGGAGKLSFLGAAVLLTALSLVPTHAVSLLAGYVWGGVAGSALAIATVALAALLGHRLLAPLCGPRVLAVLAARPRAQRIRDALLHSGARRSFSVITLLRLSPLMPFAGTNLLMAATGAPLLPYALGSLVGLAPRVIAVALLGAGLASLEMSASAHPLALWLGIAATVAAVLVVGRLARAALDQSLTETTWARVR